MTEADSAPDLHPVVLEVLERLPPQPELDPDVSDEALAVVLRHLRADSGTEALRTSVRQLLSLAGALGENGFDRAATSLYGFAETPEILSALDEINAIRRGEERQTAATKQAFAKTCLGEASRMKPSPREKPAGALTLAELGVHLPIGRAAMPERTRKK